MVSDSSLFYRSLSALRDLSAEGSLKSRFKTAYQHWDPIQLRDLKPERHQQYERIQQGLQESDALDRMPPEQLQKLITDFADLCVSTVDDLCE
jgi:hypothetical protein